MNNIFSVLLNPTPVSPFGLDNPLFVLICIALAAAAAAVGAALLIRSARRKKR